MIKSTKESWKKPTDVPLLVKTWDILARFKRVKEKETSAISETSAIADMKNGI